MANHITFTPIIEPTPVKSQPSTPSLTHSSPTRAHATHDDSPVLPPTPRIGDITWDPEVTDAAAAVSTAHHSDDVAPKDSGSKSRLAPPSHFTPLRPAEPAAHTTRLGELIRVEGPFDVYEASCPALSPFPILAYLCAPGVRFWHDRSFTDIEDEVHNFAEHQAKLASLGVPTAPAFHGLWYGEIEFTFGEDKLETTYTVFAMLLGAGTEFARSWDEMWLDEM